MGEVEVGGKCTITNSQIKMFTGKVIKHTYSISDDKEVYNFCFYIDGNQYELKNKDINFNEYTGYVCNIWGDFLPIKTTVSGKQKYKFLVLRIEIKGK